MKPKKLIAPVVLSCIGCASLLAAPSSLSVNYQGYSNNQKYTKDMFDSDIKDVGLYGNIGNGNQSIREYPAGSGYKRLLVKFAANKYGSDHLAGVYGNLAESNKYTLKYSFRFMSDWQFMLGGKIPGLGGGSVPAAGRPREDGMSCRVMWRGDSAWDGQYGGSEREYLEAYHYFLGQYRDYVAGGSDKISKFGDRTYLQDASKNQWYDIGMQVKVNKGDGNGRLAIKVNGVLKYNSEHKYLAPGQNWKMNRLMHVFFYGGGSAPWAPTQDTNLMFDNLTVTQSDL